VIQAQQSELFLSVKDNLLTYARLPGTRQSDGGAPCRCLIVEFQLGPEVDRKVQDLSGGFRRRVQVAKVFMVDTPVLFLDEFSTGMDPILKRQVMNLLRAEVEKGRTIILTTQVLNEAEDLCDDILIIDRGKQIARGDLNTLKLLSHGVYEINLAFDHLPENIQAEIAALSPIRSTIEANAIDLQPSKSKRTASWTFVSALSRNRHVLRVEVRGASLEDIFVELTTREGKELA